MRDTGPGDPGVRGFANPQTPLGWREAGGGGWRNSRSARRTERFEGVPAPPAPARAQSTLASRVFSSVRSNLSLCAAPRGPDLKRMLRPGSGRADARSFSRCIRRAAPGPPRFRSPSWQAPRTAGKKLQVPSASGSPERSLSGSAIEAGTPRRVAMRLPKCPENQAPQKIRVLARSADLIEDRGQRVYDV